MKGIKNKKQNILAIRNDVKGVVFFKATSDLDVDAIFEKLVQLVINKDWKPKYFKGNYLFINIFRYIRRLLPVQTVTSASISELEKGLRRIKVDKEGAKTVQEITEDFKYLFLVLDSCRIQIESKYK